MGIYLRREDGIERNVKEEEEKKPFGGISQDNLNCFNIGTELWN